MKKTVVLLLLSLLVGLLSGCGKDAPEFFDDRWMRSTEGDAEFIRFSEDGKFSYYCACGDPINDSDLCNGFSYDSNTQTITLDYAETTEETVTSIVVQSYSENELILNFAGDIRIFSKEETPSVVGKLMYEGEKYFLVDYPSDIFRYRLTVDGEQEKNTIYPVDCDRWDLVHYNGRLFVSELTVEEVSIYYDNYDNYDWSVTVQSVNSDQQYELPLSLKSSELRLLHNMKEMSHDETIFSEDIKTFATLTKFSRDGLIAGEIKIVLYNENWYWRSGIIDKNTEGGPEYIFKLPSTLTEKIKLPQD